MMENTQYYKDMSSIENGMITKIIRKEYGKMILEYMTNHDQVWKSIYYHHPRNREHYFMERQNVLQEMSEEEAVNIMKQWNQL